MAATLDRIERATRHLDPPFAAVDLAALRANAADLERRAAGRPIRVASKSVRVRAVLREVLGHDLTAAGGFRGIMAYSLDEALSLVAAGARDVLLGYPTVDRRALARLGSDPVAVQSVTLMVDDTAQLDLARDRVGDAPVRVCVDVDSSLRVGPVHLGVRRSPLRGPEDAVTVAIAARDRGFVPVGVMFYDAQIAGLPDSSPAVRWVKSWSARDLRERRSRVVDAVTRAVGPLEFVNGGGTGSLEVDAADPVVTEVTAGSGLYVSTLFDHYRAFAPRPAVFFALPVVRRPAPRVVTAFSGGFVASGPPGTSRLPTPVRPSGLRLVGTEGVGEVQTPLRGRAAADLRVGDRVWMRPAKSGEFLERFARVQLVADGEAREVPTYRGEGECW